MTLPVRPTISDKRAAFRRLHAGGCFVIPNPWDAGSARYLEHLGFQALATTSAGFAWSQGRADYGITRDQVIEHLGVMVAATDLPLNADFENGFAHDPAAVAANVALALQTGVAGLSIEDATGDTAQPLYALDDAIARMRAARHAIDESGDDTLLVGRTECFLVGRPHLSEAIARLQAYASAGADCLYAPGLRTREEIAAVVEALAPKPVNVLASMARGLTLQDFASMGVRRVSVGGSLARAAWGGFVRAAERIASEGKFDAFGDAGANIDLDAIFGKARAPTQ
jgi:2-methylisocitrate lyase-like PEP mutase family enzyme